MGEAKKIFLWPGIVLILIIGLIHVIDAPDSLNDALYKVWLSSTPTAPVRCLPLTAYIAVSAPGDGTSGS